MVLVPITSDRQTIASGSRVANLFDNIIHDRIGRLQVGSEQLRALQVSDIITITHHHHFWKRTFCWLSLAIDDEANLLQVLGANPALLCPCNCIREAEVAARHVVEVRVAAEVVETAAARRAQARTAAVLWKLDMTCVVGELFYWNCFCCC